MTNPNYSPAEREQFLRDLEEDQHDRRKLESDDQFKRTDRRKTNTRR